MSRAEVKISFALATESPTERSPSRCAWRPSFSRPPRYLWWSLLIFAILETLLIIGSFYFIQGFANANKSSASEVASISARRLEGLVNSQQAPIYAIGSLVELNPNWPNLNATFDTVAKTLSLSYDFVEIQAVPGGQITAMYVPGVNLTGQDLFDYKVNNFDFHKGMMSQSEITPGRSTILQNRSITMLGPWKGPGILAGGAMVCRHYIFLKDDGTWDQPIVDARPERNMLKFCPPEICTTPDNRTYWGFVATIFPLTYVTIPGLKEVREHNLRYSLVNDARDYLPYNANYPKILARSDVPPDATIHVCQTVNVFDWMTWTVCVAPSPSGSSSPSWTPDWAPALYVAASLIALFISSLIFMVLRSLDKQLEWNQVQKAQSKLLQKTLGSLETERDNQLGLLREILPDTVVSVLLDHLHKSFVEKLSTAPDSSVMDSSVRNSYSRGLSIQDVMDLATSHGEVTVIFADIKGFTTMSSTLHPSQVMLMLNDLFSRFDSILEGHDVYKVETIGDCYMAVTGLFDRYGDKGHSNGLENVLAGGMVCIDADEARGRFARRSHRLSSQRRDGGWGKLGGRDGDHASKALRFAQAMNQLASNVPCPLGSGSIQMRIGLHSGPVYSGVVGRKMPRFCLFGDTVNTASRMESTGEAGRIHVSAATAALLPSEEWEERVIEVKGKGEMKTYFHSQSPGPKKDDLLED